MRKIIVLFGFIALFLSVHECYAQGAKPYTVYDTIPIRSGTNKYRLYRLIDNWFETERGTRLVAKSRKDLKFKGRGYFIYYNRVRLPDVFLSPHANARTKGTIVFTIDVHIQDSIIVSIFSNFVHEAAYSEYGSMTFGRLMDYEKVPPGSCMEVEEWCNAVWADMKEKSTLEVKDRVSRMIPPILVRRRTFRVREEVVQEAPKEVVDPKEYLKIENYMIKEDKPAPISSPISKKSDVQDEDSQSSEKQTRASESKQESKAKASKEKSAPEPKVKEKKAGKNVEEDQDEDEEIVKEKSVKDPKPVKQKAPKKSKADDDYDDYDDY